MTAELIKKAAAASMKADVPQFEIGDTVSVSVRIIEGEKERVQVFTGTVIARKGSGIHETFTVRRIIAGQGVERIFPLHSPRVAEVKVVRKAHVRRAKLYFLRKRVGKATVLRERRKPVGGKAKTRTRTPAPKPADEPEPPAEEAEEAVVTAES